MSGQAGGQIAQTLEGTPVTKIRSNRHLISKAVQIGVMFDAIHPGWTMKDYVMHAAIAPDGYETILVDGVQRVGKSNLSLQISSWAKLATLIFKLNHLTLEEYYAATHRDVNPIPPEIYLLNHPIHPTEKELWTAVLDAIVFKSGEFVARLERVPDRDPLDCLVWDDINGHYQNMAFRINPEEYAQVDAAFTVVGTKAKIIVTNIPNATRLAKNIKDNVTIEIYVGRNKKRMMKRIFTLPGLRNLNMNTFKVDIERYSTFDIYKIPTWAWILYEDRRIKLAKDVFAKLGKVATMDEPPPGYITIAEAVKIARDAGADWGVSTMQQNASRGIWGKVRASGYLFIEEKSFRLVLEAETYRPNPTS